MAREHAHRCALEATKAGELTGPMLCALLALSGFSDATLRQPIWPSLKTLGEGYGRSARTAGRHIAALVERGWVVRQHRCRVVAGDIVPMTNLYRIDVPARWLQAVRSAAHAARQRTKGVPTPKAPQNTGARHVDDSAARAAAAQAAQRREAATRARLSAASDAEPADAPLVAELVANARSSLGTGHAHGLSPP